MPGSQSSPPFFLPLLPFLLLGFPGLVLCASAADKVPATAKALAPPPRFSSPPPESIGFSSSIRALPGGGIELGFHDLKSGGTLQVTYSRSGKIERMEERSPAGTLVDRRELAGPALVHERFDGEQVRTTIRSALGDVLWVERVRRPGTGARSARFAIPSSAATEQASIGPAALSLRSFEDGAPACRARPPAGWETLISELSWIRFNASRVGAGTHDLGNNVIARGCESYPTGVPGLALELGSTLKQGLECMSGLGPSMRMEAARMLAFFQPGVGRPATIYCGPPGSRFDDKGQAVRNGGRSPVQLGTSAGYAHRCDQPDFPAIELNTQSQDIRDGATRPGVLFHEMTHWLGHYHNDGGVDESYLVEACCFTQPQPPLQPYRQESCALLREAVPATDTRYQRGFVRAAQLLRTERLAYLSAWRISLHGGERPDGRALYETVMELEADWRYDAWREDGTPLQSLVYGETALKNIAGPERAPLERAFRERIADPYYPETDPELRIRRRLASSMAEVMDRLFNRDALGLQRTWDAFEATTRASCPSLSANESIQIQEIADTLKTDLNALQPPIPEKIHRFWRNLCP